MATSLKQLQTQKQKLAPKQVLQAKLLQLSTINLEQAVLKELEQNSIVEKLIFILKEHFCSTFN